MDSNYATTYRCLMNYVSHSFPSILDLIQTVEWDEMRFDVRLLQRVPYEGISRMQTSLRRRHRQPNVS